MTIPAITTQSVSYTTLHQENRIVTTRREYSTDNGYQTVSEIEFITYTNRGELAATKPAHQVDLYV